MLTLRYNRGLAVATFTLAATFGATSLAGAQAARTAAPKLNDPTIVASFYAANTWDVETGQIAVETGSNKEIRDFGAMLARDHKMVRQQRRLVAKKYFVTP